MIIETHIMIEGQNGLNWQRWQRIAAVVEQSGYAGLFRSDHYTNGSPPDLDSLELWTSLTWLASHTKRIEFGSLVSPVSFRHPSMTARMASAVDDLSGGRLSLGLGAGWQEREHHNYGWDLLSLPERFARFEEALQVITGLLRKNQPFSFEGRYYQLRDVMMLPRPQREGGPPIIVGGNGARFTLPLVARYADEWNCVFLNPEKFLELNTVLERLLIHEGRRPDSLRRSMMTSCIYGIDQAAVQARVAKRTQGQATADELRQRGMVVGTGSEIASQLKRLAEIGLQRVMLQWIDLEDLDDLAVMADEILPNLE
jgi:F420-dependent oxidoreductase-like protein